MSASGPPPDVSPPVDGASGDRGVASGKPPNRSPAVVGRDVELARIAELLADARRGRSGALLLEGEPGIGKTTLLDSARSLADGFAELSVTGVDAESALGHAGLLELLNPLRSLLPEVPHAQAAALGAALGWSAADAPADRFLVCAGTLSLLAAAADRAPVLVVVDDLQWVDRETAEAVMFAARRLGPDAVAFLVAARTGSVAADRVEGFGVVRLGGLPASAVAVLVPAGTTDGVVSRLVDGTQGNPLAVLEVARRLTGAQRLGAAPLPDPLPVGDRLVSTYGQLLSGLSDPARRAVLLLAHEPTAASAVASVLAAEGVDAVAAFADAEYRGVVVHDDEGLRFRHPLLRTAVLERATATERRGAHLALAEAMPGDARAGLWHRAQAAIAPDDRLADQLERLAAEDRVRLGYASASAALEASARLTGDPKRAALRLAAATEDAFMAGDVTRTRSLVDRVLTGFDGDEARGRVLFVAGVLEQYAGSVPRSTGHLDEAALLLEGAPRVRALTELALARFRLGDAVGMADCANRIEAVVDLSDIEQRLLCSFTRGLAHVLAGRLDAGHGRLAEVRDLGRSAQLRHDPRALMLWGLSVWLTGDVAKELPVAVARLEEFRRRGAVGVLVPIIGLLTGAQAKVGDHAGAYAGAGEADELAQQVGYAADASVAAEMLAWQSAARGLHDEAATALARAKALIDRAGLTSAAAHHAITAAFCALCRSDLDLVVDLLESRIRVDGGLGESGEPLGVAPLLVEAYAAVGRTEDAADLTRRYTEVVEAFPTPTASAFLGRCKGLSRSDEPAALAAFEEALVAHAEAGDVFETARTRLLYGSRLRRGGKRVAAREQLRIAHDSFTEMDLTLWARAAAHELASTGATARRGATGLDEPLSSQETRVALMVATGMSNREVAAALFLSPKTVERHLGNVFRKRGFRSRTELAAAYARAAAGPGD